MLAILVESLGGSILFVERFEWLIVSARREHVHALGRLFRFVVGVGSMEGEPKSAREQTIHLLLTTWIACGESAPDFAERLDEQADAFAGGLGRSEKLDAIAYDQSAFDAVMDVQAERSEVIDRKIVTS